MQLSGGPTELFRLDALSKAGIGDVQSLPFSLRVLLENLLRYEDDNTVTKADIEALAQWDPKAEPSTEIAFRPARVVLQDFTDVPAVATANDVVLTVVEMLRAHGCVVNSSSFTVKVSTSSAYRT